MTKRVFSTLLAGLLLFAACGKDDDNGSNGEWVDLGLPSGLLWYSVNLGATTPEGYGDYYAWGETTTKSTYSWATYTYCTGDYNALTKYCTNSWYGDNGFKDNKAVLEAMDDAATQVMDDGARIPTYEEWEELLNNTTAMWTTQKGVYGIELTSTANDQSLFLPAAGYHRDDELDFSGEVGYYWSSSLDKQSPGSALGLELFDDVARMGGGWRSNGLSVRAVRSAR